MVYYFRFADLLTDGTVLELSAPFTADRRIIQPGAFSCTIPVPNSSMGAMVNKIVPQRTICHVYRDSMIIGSYIVWSKTASIERSGQASVALQGATLESYLYHRFISQDATFVGEEQLEIADWLVSEAMSGPPGYESSADLGITVRAYTPSGVTRDREYLASSCDTVGDLLEALASVDNGFEYAIHTYESGPTGRVFEMQYGYPGLNCSSARLVLEHPGNLTSMSFLYDGTAGGTVFRARGKSVAADAGEVSEPLLSDLVLAEGFLDQGFPVLDVKADYQNVSVKSTLDAYASWWASNRSGPVITPSFSVAPQAMFAAGFSPFSLGSQIAVVMDNPLFPCVDGSSTFGGTPRLIGFELSVDQSGADEMKLIIETGFDPTEIGG